MNDLIQIARNLADDELLPRASAVDAAGVVPTGQLDLLADAGLYGLFTPPAVGGLGADTATVLAVIEALAGGCLTTTFVWVQHGGPSRACAATSGPMHDAWAKRLATGEARGGVAFAHLLRKGEPMLAATPTSSDSDADWILDGTAPFVTGWGHIDVFLAAARHGDDVIWFLLDAIEASSLRSKRLCLAAVDASETAEISLSGHRVSAERVTHAQPFQQWLASYHAGLRTNGSLALGVTGRCLQLLGSSPLDGEIDRVRLALDTADQAELPHARTDASLLAVRASTALLAKAGGSGMSLERDAQRLARESLFLLVQGQTPDIKRLMVEQLTRK